MRSPAVYSSGVVPGKRRDVKDPAWLVESSASGLVLVRRGFFLARCWARRRPASLVMLTWSSSGAAFVFVSVIGFALLSFRLMLEYEFSFAFSFPFGSAEAEDGMTGTSRDADAAVNAASSRNGFSLWNEWITIVRPSILVLIVDCNEFVTEMRSGERSQVGHKRLFHSLS